MNALENKLADLQQRLRQRSSNDNYENDYDDHSDNDNERDNYNYEVEGKRKNYNYNYNGNDNGNGNVQPHPEHHNVNGDVKFNGGSDGDTETPYNDYGSRYNNSNQLNQQQRHHQYQHDQHYSHNHDQPYASASTPSPAYNNNLQTNATASKSTSSEFPPIPMSTGTGTGTGTGNGAMFPSISESNSTNADSMDQNTMLKTMFDRQAARISALRAKNVAIMEGKRECEARDAWSDGYSDNNTCYSSSSSSSSSGTSNSDDDSTSSSSNNSHRNRKLTKKERKRIKTKLKAKKAKQGQKLLKDEILTMKFDKILVKLDSMQINNVGGNGGNGGGGGYGDYGQQQNMQLQQQQQHPNFAQSLPVQSNLNSVQNLHSSYQGLGAGGGGWSKTPSAANLQKVAEHNARMLSQQGHGQGVTPHHHHLNQQQQQQQQQGFNNIQQFQHSHNQQQNQQFFAQSQNQAQVYKQPKLSNEEEDADLKIEEQLQYDLSVLLQDDNNSDSDSNDDAALGGDNAADKLKRERNKRNKKNEELKNALNRNLRDYNDVLMPRYRYEFRNMIIPLNPDGTQRVMKGRMLFRAVVFHLLAFYAGPIVRLRKYKLERKDGEAKQFDNVLGVYYEQVRTWVNKECRLVITSVLVDSMLDLDVVGSVIPGVGSGGIFSRLFKLNGSSNPIASITGKNDRMLKLKIRVKGIIHAIARQKPSDPIFTFFEQYMSDGNYFPKDYFHSSETALLTFSDVGGTRCVLENRILVKLLFTNFFLLRILIGQVIQFPWLGGLGRLPKGSNCGRVCGNLQVLGSVVYEVLRISLNIDSGVRAAGANKGEGVGLLPKITEKVLPLLYKVTVTSEGVGKDVGNKVKTRTKEAGDSDDESESDDEDDEDVDEDENKKEKDEVGKVKIEGKTENKTKAKAKDTKALTNKEKRKRADLAKKNALAQKKIDKNKKAKDEARQKSDLKKATKASLALLNLGKSRRKFTSADHGAPSRNLMEFAEIANNLLPMSHFGSCLPEIMEYVHELASVLNSWVDEIVDDIIAPPRLKIEREEKEREEEVERFRLIEVEEMRVKDEIDKSEEEAIKLAASKINQKQSLPFLQRVSKKGEASKNATAVGGGSKSRRPSAVPVEKTNTRSKTQKPPRDSEEVGNATKIEQPTPTPPGSRPQSPSGSLKSSKSVRSSRSQKSSKSNKSTKSTKSTQSRRASNSSTISNVAVAQGGLQGGGGSEEIATPTKESRPKLLGMLSMLPEAVDDEEEGLAPSPRTTKEKASLEGVRDDPFAEVSLSIGGASRPVTPNKSIRGGKSRLGSVISVTKSMSQSSRNKALSVNK